MPRNINHSYHLKQYSKETLGLYLVRCNSKENKQGAITIAILAPLVRELKILELSEKFIMYGTDKNGILKKYTFSVRNYIKASAIRIASQIDFNSKDASVWKPDSYESSDIIANFGSVQKCLLKKKGKIINDACTQGLGFDDAMDELRTYGRTTCVDFKELQQAYYEG